jgi:hypothetical protein
VTRRYFGRAGFAIALGFVIVLLVPDDDRVVALYALVLFVGALALGGLVALLVVVPPTAYDRLAGPQASVDVHPTDLDEIERDVRDALAAGVTYEPLREVIRSIVSARLARHGRRTDLSRGAATEAVLADSAVWQLLDDSSKAPRARRLSAQRLGLVIDELERL